MRAQTRAGKRAPRAIHDLRAELAATVRDLAGVVAALEAERELVQLLAPSGPSCPVQVAETRARIVARLARERAFVAQVEALVANAGNEAS